MYRREQRHTYGGRSSYGGSSGSLLNDERGQSAEIPESGVPGSVGVAGRAEDREQVRVSRPVKGNFS